MKKNKHICFINLVLFLASFLLLSINGMSANTGKNTSDRVHKMVTEKQDSIVDGSLQQLSENETETESDFEALSVILPFYFSPLHTEILNQPVFSPEKTTEPTCKPIYIAVRNFRI